MNVLVTTDARYCHTPDGATWTHTVFDRRFWRRYLDVFDQVKVLARSQEVAEPPAAWRRVDGNAITVAHVPYYRGPWEYAVRRSAVVGAVRAAVSCDEAVVFRVPTVFAGILHPDLRRQRRPYAVEVIADAYRNLAPGAAVHSLRPFLRHWMAWHQRVHCRDAAAAGYVTEQVLQRSYPPGPQTLSTHYSSIELDDAAFVSDPRRRHVHEGSYTLLAIGSLDQLYKGPDVLIEAVGLLVAANVDVRAVWLGDGVHRADLERRAHALHLRDRIRFAGEVLPGSAVRKELDCADLFVMPSRSEGLPRALIEAMARGLPCVASAVGGIPELLPSDEMVPASDPVALAAAIRAVLADPGRLARMSARNLAKAFEYRAEALQARRVVLYRHLRDKTAEWIAA